MNPFTENPYETPRSGEPIIRAELVRRKPKVLRFWLYRVGLCFTAFAWILLLGSQAGGPWGSQAEVDSFMGTNIAVLVVLVILATIAIRGAELRERDRQR